MSIRKQYDTDLEALKAALVEMGSNSAEAVEAALEALCTADAEAAQKVIRLMEALDDYDDVQKVYANADFPEDMDMD